MQFTPIPITHPAINAMLVELRRSHTNGGALAACFSYEPSNNPNWFISRTTNGSVKYVFDPFLTSSALAEALPELRLDEGPNKILEFTWLTGFTLDGELAVRVAHGGEYYQFEGTGAQAKRCAWRLAMRCSRDVMPMYGYSRLNKLQYGLPGFFTWHGTQHGLLLI